MMLVERRLIPWIEELAEIELGAFEIETELAIVGKKQVEYLDRAYPELQMAD